MSNRTLWRRNRRMMVIAAFVVMTMIIFGCGGGGNGDSNDGGGGQVTNGEFVVLAWNDLGMHCLNPTYDQLIILPPYNTVWAQVIERGNPPRIVTDGVEVSYSILDNTTSQDKLFYDQFWDPAVLALFGAAGLAPDTGLNLHDPTIHNGLSGSMQLVGDHFQADGIPVTPVNDGAAAKNPYQTALITVKNATGATLVQTQAMVPTSDEIDCGKCHAPGGTITQAFADILQKHDDERPVFNLQNSMPVLCASCHGSPALGSAADDRGSSGKYLSEAIHGSHAGRTAPPNNAAIACYDCHPGRATQCNRSLAHTDANGNCTTCHGTMDLMAGLITSNVKVPWLDEPGCVMCHPNDVAEVDTGATLYRNAAGHGGLYCAACHQSPHAMVPSREAGDNYQVLQYQKAKVRIASIGSCRACHATSKPEGGNLKEFAEKHAGANPEERSACAVCHTGLPANIAAAQFPHQFAWASR